MTRKKGWKERDPDADNEAKRYRFPIPSRALILETLENLGRPVALTDLAASLGLKGQRTGEALAKRAQAMVRDGELIRNRKGLYCLTAHVPVVVGTVQGHRDGFGFLIPDAGGDDVFLSARQMRQLMHGDRAAVRIRGEDRRGRPEGSVVEVLERRTTEIVGRFFREGGLGFVEPDNSRYSQSVSIAPRQNGGAREGQIVIAEIISQPTDHGLPVGKIVRVLGDASEPGMETQIAIASHGLPHHWPDEVEKAVQKIGSKVSEAAKQDRYDLRDIALVTIDGADAKDFDDAVYCERNESGWTVLVAIADVAHYVGVNDALDDEAQNRATSVYFPRGVIPMLPEELSNGLCSLKPNVDRLCLVCEMLINRSGKVTASEFYEAVMHSAARLTYHDAADIVVKRDATARNKHRALLDPLDELYAVYKVMAGARRRRGALDFDVPEVKARFGRDGHIVDLVAYERNDAHKIIEECMIAANIEAARFLRKKKMPFLYRSHAGPAEDRVADLRLFLAAQGLSLGGGKRPEPAEFGRLLEKVIKRDDAQLIETVLLRTLAQAVYEPDNAGHFGLALQEYAHFTSPIRRYPDLLVHRAIKHVLAGRKPARFAYSQKDMVRLGQQCSQAERRADDATRQAMDYLKCEYLLDKIDEEFDAVIAGVTNFGLFAQIRDKQIDGLVHVSALPPDYYEHDPVHFTLTGEKTGRVFRLSDQIRVRVARVDLDERKIDFDPVESAATEKAPRTKSGRRRRR